MSELLKKFLNLIEKPELFKTNQLTFIYSATKLNWDDNTKIEEKFIGEGNAYIFVNDTENHIGG